MAFLRKVWPHQLAVQTPVMVGRLCKLAFDDEPHFPELVSAILPLVSHAEGGTINLLLMGDKDKLITKNYPNPLVPG